MQLLATKRYIYKYQQPERSISKALASIYWPICDIYHTTICKLQPEYTNDGSPRLYNKWISKQQILINQAREHIINITIITSRYYQLQDPDFKSQKRKIVDLHPYISCPILLNKLMIIKFHIALFNSWETQRKITFLSSLMSPFERRF